MLIILLVVAALFLGFGVFLYIKELKKNKRDRNDAYFVLNMIGGFSIVMVIIAMITVGSSLSNNLVIDEKIDMYQQENQTIQSEVASAVENYMEYESNTYKNIKTESPITLATVFPELKSNELVAKQIEVYVANNQKIKSLKEQKLNNKVLAWWLYFGK